MMFGVWNGECVFSTMIRKREDDIFRFDGLGWHWPAIVTCGMFNWFKRGKVFQQYALRLGYWVRVKVAMKESTLINNSFLN